MNDRGLELVRSAMAGSRDSYGLLVMDFTGFVYTMALRLTGDHHMAEDLCQDIFLKGWLRIRDLKDPGAFPGWIATLARRTCLTALEKRRRRMELQEGEADLENLNPSFPEYFDPARRILEEAMMRLTLQERELLTMCYFQEMDSVEAGEIAGLPPGTVRVYLHRARKKLYDMLKGRENELLG